MTESVPAHLRPTLFAVNELLLDLIQLLQGYFKTDLESIMILLCVTDATMRPFMRGADTPEQILTAPRPPEEVRGSISRRMIADKLKLSRETVRRKTQELAEIGLIAIDGEDRVRSAVLLGDPAFREGLENAHAIVVRYQAHLRTYGIDFDQGPTS